MCHSCLKSFSVVEALSDSDTRGGCPQTRSSKASGKDSQYHPSSKFQALHCSAQHYTYRPAHLSWPQCQEHPVPWSNACHTESKHLEDSKMQFVCVNQNANDEYLCWGCISSWQIGSGKLSGSPFSMHFEAFWPIPSCMAFKIQHILMLQLSQNLHEISHSEDQQLSIWQWCPSQPTRMCKIAKIEGMDKASEPSCSVYFYLYGSNQCNIWHYIKKCSNIEKKKTISNIHRCVFFPLRVAEKSMYLAVAIMSWLRFSISRCQPSGAVSAS